MSSAPSRDPIATKPAGWRKWFWPFLKIAILGLSVIWIVVQSRKDWNGFVQQEKNWSYLGLAFFFVLSAHLISYWRWQLLVNGLGVPISTASAVRLGFLGTLLNQVSIGSVGGDLFKAIEAAQRAKDKKTEVVASVLVDRAVGLLGLLMVASGGMVIAPSLSPRLSAIQWVALLLSGLGLGILILIGVLGARIPLHWLRRLPGAGHTIYRLAKACMIFHGRPRLIVEVIGSSLLVHICFTLACFLISNALFSNAPSVAEHFAAIPPAMAAATLPITPGGVGVLEIAIAGLFRELPSLPEGYSPWIMATTLRLLLICVSLIGAVYYFFGFGNRREPV
ncbi:lysylphosphatidylglycerol synthase transmembrane domain-containing protein [Pirellulaceae bacterium SH467]